MKVFYFIVAILFICGNSFAQMAGNYTIGPNVSDDFATISDAVTLLSTDGVSDSVIFSIADGTYNEQIVIPEITGASSVNTITFKSQNQDATSVIVQYANATTNDNYVLKLNGADYLIFDHLTIMSTNSSYGRVLNITANADYNTFQYCRIVGIPTETYYDAYTLVYSNNTKDQYNTFENNYFLNGSYGFRYKGNSSSNLSAGTVITNNQFINQNNTGIYAINQEAINISNNLFDLNNTDAVGINLEYCDRSINISNNIINIALGTTGIYMYYCDGNITEKGQIINNAIWLGGSISSANGIYINGGTYQNVFHNSVNLSSSQATSSAFKGSGGNNLDVRNNVFCAFGSGYALYSASSGIISTCDYNDYFSSGNFLAYWGTNVLDLPALQTTNSMDQHSIASHPFFVSNSDLHTTSFRLDNIGDMSVGVATDIEGNARTGVDLGAYEFTGVGEPLNGTYEIGGVSADFSTIYSAVDSLNKVGVSGAVIFNINTGSYNEQFKIYNITGASSVNTITFQSATGNVSDVDISYIAGSSNNYIVKLASTDYTIFKNLTFTTSDPTYSTVFRITGNASNDSIVGCVLNGIYGSNDNNSIIYSSDEYFKDIVIKDNTFYNGRYAIYLAGTSSYHSTGIEILNNEISDCYSNGVYLKYCDNSVLSYNTLNNSLSTYFYGIYLEYCNEENHILNNNIHSTLSNGGIYVKSCTGTATKRTLVANNFITIEGTSYAYGIRTASTSNIDIYYNSINIESNHTSYGAAFKNESGSNVRLKNNILANMGGGYAIENSSSSAVTESNYNNLLTNGNYIAKIDGTARISFADYQAATSLDNNSVCVYPGFTSSNDLHTNSPFLDGAGTPLTDVLDDYDGETRNVSTPDIGADEFTSTITPLAGVYTIGGTSPDFATISDAVYALNNYGISDVVTFNIRPGTYTEQNSLFEIPGANENDTVIFQSENGDSSSVIITYNSLTDGQNYIFSMSNTDYITFNKLTLTATGPTYARCLYFNGATHDINITNCRLLSTNNSTSSVIFTSQDNNSNYKIKNNYIHEGAIGIYLNHGDDYHCTGTEIVGNSIQSSSDKAIYLDRHDAPIIRGNEIHNEGNSFYGIYIENCKNAITITSNKIYNKYDTKGIYMKACIGSIISPALIANNFVTMEGTSTSTGINIETSDYINLYHNSLLVTSTYYTGKALYIASGTNYKVKNNIISNTGGGYSMYMGTSVGILECNYNNIYSKDTNYFAYYGSTLHSLYDWQQATGYDANSISYDPMFYSITDLHTLQSAHNEAGTAIAEVTTDIDGVTRDSSTPDIGAQEFYCETPTFNAVFSTTCMGDSTTITDASTNVAAGSTYSWDFDGDYEGDYVTSTANESINSYFENSGSNTVNLIISQLGGCLDFQSFNVDIYSNPEFTISTEGAYCDSANGSATVNITSGTSPFSYAWSTGDNSSTIYNVEQGEYSVAIVDANGCFASGMAEVGNAITVDVSQISEATCGASDGIATVSVTGGVEPYYYLWSNGVTTQNDSTLSPGTHFVNVIDNNGCALISHINIENDGSGPIITTLSTTNNNCYGDNDGSINILVTGGVIPYTYLWSNGETTEDISNLYKGIYQITVTDSVGCISVKDFTITSPSKITVTSVVENASCAGSDGVAVVAVSGGNEPYLYSWETGSTSSIQTGLAAGIYSVTVTDAYNCQTIEPIIINNVGAPTININSVTGATCTSTNSGAINIGISGGTPLYTYNWSSGQTSQDISGVPTGTYTVTVTDNAGCSAAETITIEEELPTTPQICMVTVDTTNGKNLIVWEKSIGEGIASYNIYKESNQANVYNLIGNVLYDDESIFTDVTADPAVRSWRYKLSAIDSCGNETEMGEMHKTMHLTVNLGLNNTINLIWDHYQGFEFVSYEIQRYSPSQGLEVVETISSNNFTYTDQNPPADAQYYQVAAVRTDVCNVNTGAKTQLGPYSQSISNLDDTGMIEHVCGDVFETPAIIGNIQVAPSGQESYHVNDVNGYTYTWSVTGGTIDSGQNTDNVVITWGAIGSGSISVSAEDQYGCPGTTSNLDITINIDEFDISSFISVYPNPNNGKFNILASHEELINAQLLIFDITGKTIFSEQFENKTGNIKKEIELAGLSKGIYYLQLKAEKYTATKKLIVE